MNSISTDKYQLCKRCVMDTSASDIRFDYNGFCNYCNEFYLDNIKVDKTNYISIDELFNKIKSNKKNNKYDCIVGVSGGVDSSWVLYKAVEFGLRPLAVHMDNGWNSEIAQNNIANLVNNLKVDLYTHVINWDEYRSLMQSFFDADVVDIELLYDNAMLAVNFTIANSFNAKYILSGFNKATEGIRIPRSWSTFKYDQRNIFSINKKFQNIKINTFPSIGTLKRIYFEIIKGIKWCSPLDLMDYKKDDALKVLVDKFDYKPYPYKHYESVFTRFYQGYILPNKFGIDKRRLHLSNLILTNQMKREDALFDLSKIPYPSREDMDNDISYFLKKMKWTNSQLTEYLLRPSIDHKFYGSEERYYNYMKNLYNKIF